MLSSKVGVSRPRPPMSINGGAVGSAIDGFVEVYEHLWEMHLDLQRPQTGILWSHRAFKRRHGSHDRSFPLRLSSVLSKTDDDVSYSSVERISRLRLRAYMVSSSDIFVVFPSVGARKQCKRITELWDLSVYKGLLPRETLVRGVRIVRGTGLTTFEAFWWKV